MAQTFLGKSSSLNQIDKAIVFGLFTLTTLYLTNQSIKMVSNYQSVKEEENRPGGGYTVEEEDVKLVKVADVIKLAIFCSIAAVLCGMTGIAGGMVLGPLFLSYNMLPQMMSATN